MSTRHSLHIEKVVNKVTELSYMAIPIKATPLAVQR